MEAMAFADRASPKDRVVIAIAVAALHVALGWALILGLAVRLPEQVERQLALFTPLPALPHPPEPPEAIHKAVAPRREGAAAPPALKATAAPVVAPPPVVVTPVPPPVTVAPLPQAGAASHAGAAPIAGPGSGAGGIGDGFGSGGAGDGSGGGGGGRDWEPVSAVKDKDYPLWAADAGVRGTVGVRFVIGVRGRLTDCVVTSSSGSRELDAMTCPIMTKRLRFRPRLDRAGHPVPAVVEGTQAWAPHGSFEGEEPDDDR